MIRGRAVNGIESNERRPGRLSWLENCTNTGQLVKLERQSCLTVAIAHVEPMLQRRYDLSLDRWRNVVVGFVHPHRLCGGQ